MKKEEFVKKLLAELERLENVEHVSDLANNGRYEEVDAIIAEIDYSFLSTYIEDGGWSSIELSDIPEELRSANIIFLTKSPYDEMDILSDTGYRELRDDLLLRGAVGKKVREAFKNNCFINEFETFFQLMTYEF